jgi:hypothetical protein
MNAIARMKMSVESLQVAFEYDMKNKELMGVYELLKEGHIFEALSLTFEYGYYQGRRAEKTKPRKCV